MSDAFHVVHVVLAVDVGGMERGLINQIREALRLGERVTVVCLERPGVLAPQLEALGVPVLCLHKKPGFRWGLVRRMAEVFRPLRPDVVHTHQPATMFYGVPAARRAGVPVIVHTQHGKFFAAERWRWRWLGWLAGRHLTRFFCLTQDIAREVTSHGIVPASKVEIIVNGIDTARFQGGDGAEELRESLRIPPAAPVVGTVARLTAIKRQDLLLSAFARVRERVPDAHLVLVGDGPLLGPLRGLAGDLGLAECVHFAGYQDRPERFYPLMDVFALTSESEGMPQSVMEAGAARVPVVASRVGGLAEAVADGTTGLLFPSGDQAALTTALVRLLSDRELSARLAAAAHEQVETRFHVRRMAADYHRHFRQWLPRRAGSDRGGRLIRA